MYALRRMLFMEMMGILPGPRAGQTSPEHWGFPYLLVRFKISLNNLVLADEVERSS